jgi:primosomal protein N' (replication factor Y)
MLIKAPKGAALQPAIKAWLAPLKIPNSIRIAVDIDPQSFW